MTTRPLAGRYRVVLFAVSLTLLLGPAASVSAYHTDDREGDYACVDCHGEAEEEWTGRGPHGYYTSETIKCRMCHMVHDAPGESILLLPAPTITGTCFTCHDSTGGVGTYSAITARGGTVEAEHGIGTTSTVPGGSMDLSTNLECVSCHSVHGATSMEPFVGDSRRWPNLLAPYESNKLLRDDLNGAPRGTYTQYGGAWCAACHDLRTSGGPEHNHPTDESLPYGLGMDGADPWSTNEKFRMEPVGTAPRVDPYCQFCHEDARDVESEYETNLKDYGDHTDQPINPVFITFPHQSTNPYFRVERGDDLCDNCHVAGDLP